MENNNLLNLIAQIDGLISKTIKIKEYEKMGIHLQNVDDGIEVVIVKFDEKYNEKCFIIKGVRLSSVDKVIYSTIKEGNIVSCQLMFALNKNDSVFS